MEHHVPRAARLTPPQQQLLQSARATSCSSRAACRPTARHTPRARAGCPPPHGSLVLPGEVLAPLCGCPDVHCPQGGSAEALLSGTQ